jgi:large subunit ribosomal protein L37Ae
MTKLGSASRYGSRYGTPLKQIVNKIEKIQKTAQICPQCGRKSLKRKGYAKWVCGKCGAQIAGGAYSPQTEVGAIVERIIRKGEKYEEIAKETEKKKE